MNAFYSSKYYQHLPVSLQNAFVTAKGMSYGFIRKGLRPSALNAALLQAETMDEEELRRLQFRKVIALVDHAWRNVPFYRRQFSAIGFHPGDLKSLGDLAGLPFIDKQIVLDNYRDLFAANYRGKVLVSGATSGTTGASLKLKMDPRLIHLEYAFARRQFRWAGLPERGGRIALLRGDMIVPVGQEGPPFWRYDSWGREMWFSSYHLSERSAPHYLSELERFDPSIIYAFPSALSFLASYADAHGRRPGMPSLRGIVTSSETFLDFEREKISRIFGARIFDWYGQFERVIFIGTCEEGQYHVFPDYGITELLPIDNDENGNLRYELVGTGFLNRVMPLIRYRTGDTVALSDHAGRCACGRHFRQVRSISGRMEDAIITADGRTLRTAPSLFKFISGIRIAQIIQDSIDAVTVLIVPGPEFNAAEEEKLKEKIQEQLTSRMRVEIKKVPWIAPGRNGKLKLVVSHIPQQAPRKG
jgi:phenylacetate-CoA ligase